MRDQRGVNNEFDSLISVFLGAGCSIQATLRFVYDNYDHLLENKDSIMDNIYFIYNNDSLYAILMMFEDRYEWAIYNNDNFYSIQSSMNIDDKDRDYIIEMILGFANTEKIKGIVPDVGEMNLKGKVRVLKKLGLNSKGYHLR